MASSQPYYAHTGTGTSSAGSPIVVVQGVNVTNKSSSTTHQQRQYHHDDGDDDPEVAGAVTTSYHQQRQANRCNDVFFAILFYAHLGLIAYLTVVFVPQVLDDTQAYYDDAAGGNRMLNNHESSSSSSSSSASLWSRLHWWVGDAAIRVLQEDENDGQENNNNNNEDGVVVNMSAILTILGVSAIAGFVLSGLCLHVMMHFATGLIKFALWYNILAPLVMAILSLLAGVVPLAVVCIFMCALAAYYAYVVWNRIPFAAVNMQTAVTAVQANFGLTFFAYNALILSFGWTVWWSVTAMSTLYVTSACTADGCQQEPNGLILFGLLVSYYWTIQVIKNTVHTTVCGTVGTWWFAPHEASSCCSKAVWDSFCRSITWSFGSICFGSLIVAIISAVKEMVRSSRDSGDGGILLCCAECLLGCIESLVEYFNQWAYVFVALYGFSFMEAGMNVMTLFRQRGWTTIITDMLVDGVLVMVSVAIGLATGLTAFIVAQTTELYLYGAEGPSAFLIGFVIGALFASTLLGIVSSAVNTVIVCYAEAPNEFEQNHPKLSQDMRQAWRQAFPVDFKY